MIVLDRVEGTRAVLLVGGEPIEVPASELPAGAAEGAVLALCLDAGASRRARAEAAALQERVKRNSPRRGGSFDL